MITVSKEFQWAMAHMLDGHEGLCKNLHGHEYKLIVTVTDDRVDINDSRLKPKASLGMVVDFKQLKDIVNNLIVKPLDHALMINSATTDDFERELMTLAQKFEKKHFLIACRPTAENMVQAFAMLLINNFIGTGIKLTGLRLYETPTSYADWSEGDK